MVLWGGQVCPNRRYVTSVTHLDFSPRAGMATPSLLIFHRWGRGWEIGISSRFYGAARQVHQSFNLRKEGIVSNLLVVVWVFCSWLLKAKSQI